MTELDIFPYTDSHSFDYAIRYLKPEMLDSPLWSVVDVFKMFALPDSLVEATDIEIRYIDGEPVTSSYDLLTLILLLANKGYHDEAKMVLRFIAATVSSGLGNNVLDEFCRDIKDDYDY